MAILHFRCKERRRTVRVLLSVPLRVHGITAEGETYAVDTKSHTVSLHGASMEVGRTVALGDVLLLEHGTTHEQAEAKVVNMKKSSRDGKVLVGVEFTDRNLNFWHVVFPAPGARPLRRQVAERVSVLA
jgi:PilZ domain